MFTGLIEDIGIVKTVSGNGGKITVKSEKIVKGISEGDSININGVCQTVVDYTKDNFSVVAVEETLKKTNLKNLKINDNVNLESSLTLGKKLGGHFVLGHVDSTGKIEDIRKLPTSYLLKVAYPSEYEKFIIHVGSVAVDGVSLTIADYNQKTFTVSIIPHTWENTIFKYTNIGKEINLEFDMLGKYVAKMLGGKKENSDITEEWLKGLGY